MSEDAVGTIELGRSTRLIFTISWWKGRQYAGVRKHVETSRYSGPTKSGLAMAGDVLMGVINALAQLKAEVPGPEARQYARIAKAGGAEIVISVIPPDDLKALPSVDVREYIDIPGYQGPTKKGVRFPWDKLPEFIGLLETQARRIGSSEKAQPVLFPEARPGWVKKAETAGQGQLPGKDAVLSQILPDGPKDFPADFTNRKKPAYVVSLPAEPIAVVQQPDGTYVVQSDFAFRHDVRNPTEGNFIYYASLRGHREIRVPKEMLEVFRAVKAYENYLRDLRHALLQAYERKSGHRPMAQHQTKEVFDSAGLPWVE